MNLLPKNRVLVPIDFSEESFQAQDMTLAFVEDASHLHVLHVLSHMNAGDPGVMWEGTNSETRKRNVEKTFYERCSGPEYAGIHFSVAIGDPSSEIIDYAEANKIELIVVPSHGRTGLGRFFMGSVAERVVRFAHCPVLVLRR